MNQRPQHKTRHTEPDRNESGECIGTGDKFLKRTSIAQVLRSIIDKLNFKGLKSFYEAKDTINRTKWQPAERERFSLTTHLTVTNFGNIERT